MRRTYRITTVAIAMFLGVGLVVLLLIAGKSVKGPLEDLFVFAQETVNSLEKKLIVDQRSDKRANKLEWLKPYKKNFDLLKNPKEILFGAYDNNTRENFESIINLEDSLHITFPLIHIYTAWGDKPEQEFPRLQVKSIIELGSVPVITWEPWLTDFDIENHPELPPIEKRDKGGLADVAKGTYDFYLIKWAKEAKRIDAPIFLRVGHEMNDPYRYPWGPHNNSAKDFIAAWRHIVEVFKKEGVSNILWVWSPHPAYGLFRDYYPGAEYVDYVGSGVLNYGTAATWSKWWTFKEIFGNYYDQLSSFNKPIMIAEFGSLTVGGERSEWFAQALNSLPKHYPAVKSVLFFHFSEDRTTTQQTLNWYLINDSMSLQEIRKRINKMDMDFKY
jgi:hypothetical protein